MLVPPNGTQCFPTDPEGRRTNADITKKFLRDPIPRPGRKTSHPRQLNRPTINRRTLEWASGCVNDGEDLWRLTRSGGMVSAPFQDISNSRLPSQQTRAKCQDTHQPSQQQCQEIICQWVRSLEHWAQTRAGDILGHFNQLREPLQRFIWSAVASDRRPGQGA